MLTRARAWRPSDPVALGVLAGLLLLGGLLRLGFLYAWRPGFLGYPDSGVYLHEAATGEWWFDPLRTGGYAIFLQLVHALSAKLTAAIVVQHGLGLLAAVLLFAAVRRLGSPAGVALVPAAVVLLSGGQVFLEHAALSDSLFHFLMCAALYAAARCPDGNPVGWPIALGLACGLATSVRVVGLALVPVFVVWLGLAGGPGLRRRLAAGALVAVSAGAVVLTYAAENDRHTGFFGLTRNHAWQPYARVAPIAKCSAFDPPAGTRFLCESTPVDQRLGPNHYLYDRPTPAVMRFGGAFTDDYENANRALSRFTRKVVLNQPLDFAGVVLDDLWRFVDSEHPGPGEGLAYIGLISHNLIHQVPRQPAPYYTPGFFVREQYTDELVDYEEATRIDGLTIVLLFVLALASPLLATGRARRGAALLLAVTLTIMVVPVATFYWDARFAIPVYGPLAATAAAGAWALRERLRGGHARRRRNA